jgi:vacuolar-type H+-ATPase subunit H
MGTIVEKLSMIREAEEKARQALETYRRMAEEAVAQARDEVPVMIENEEAKARVKGERLLRQTIEHANAEAEELRTEYMLDRARLLSVVAERQRDAVAFLVDKLESGE